MGKFTQLALKNAQPDILTYAITFKVGSKLCKTY